jgi:hypothetical protein
MGGYTYPSGPFGQGTLKGYTVLLSPPYRINIAGLKLLGPFFRKETR